MNNFFYKLWVYLYFDRKVSTNFNFWTFFFIFNLSNFSELQRLCRDIMVFGQLIQTPSLNKYPICPISSPTSLHRSASVSNLLLFSNYSIYYEYTRLVKSDHPTSRAARKLLKPFTPLLLGFANFGTSPAYQYSIIVLQYFSNSFDSIGA